MLLAPPGISTVDLTLDEVVTPPRCQTIAAKMPAILPLSHTHSRGSTFGNFSVRIRDEFLAGVTKGVRETSILRDER